MNRMLLKKCPKSDIIETRCFWNTARKSEYFPRRGDKHFRVKKPFRLFADPPGSDHLRSEFRHFFPRDKKPENVHREHYDLYAADHQTNS